VSSTRILGIDPGSRHLGVGCIEKKGSALQLVLAHIIHAPVRDDLYSRLDLIYAELNRLLDRLKPHEVAVEDIFHAKNARSAFHLGIARGVAIAACLGRGIKIYAYAPTQVKSVVTGYGRADKEQVKKMVRLTLGTDVELGYDATDAVAVAICHASMARLGEFISC
jgi:crossover junction endodeoxyribonuclease RuvC